MHIKTRLTLLFITALAAGYIPFNAFAINPGAIASASAGNASEPKLYNYFFHGENLKIALSTYAKNSGLKIQFADVQVNTLNKVVTGQINVTRESELLDVLAKRFGFNWFIYSGILYISSKEQVSKEVKVIPENMPSVKASLQQDELLNIKFGYAEIPSQNTIVISGPRAYVDLVVRRIGELHVLPSSQQFAIYRLKYVSAVDIQLNFNNQQITIPGVATILQSLLQGKQNSITNIGNNPLSNKIIEPIKNQLNQEAISKQNASQPASDGIEKGRDGSLSSPLIQADARSNSVVIRDKASNLAIYKNLIEILDVPTPLIQVEVMIIHLDQKKLNQAGVNWWASANSAAGGFGAANLAQGPGNNLSFNYGNVAPGQLLVTNMGSFFSSLQFLEENKYAKTVGKPSLATTDSIPAIINVSENLYLNGQATNSTTSNVNNQYNYMTAQIVQALQITPHVIFHDNAQRDISLSIVLQDGAINAQNNAALPDTVQSTLTSQAVIKEGQSILLAGYTRDQLTEIEHKVPGLGDIPLLGWFFKTTSKDNHQIATLYLVTPKVIWQHDMYRLKDYVMVDNSKFDVKSNYEIVPKESAVEIKSGNTSDQEKITPQSPGVLNSESTTTNPGIQIKDNYSLKLGSFSLESNAKNVCNKAGFYGKTEVTHLRGYYICSVGYFKTREEAIKAQKELNLKLSINSIIVHT